MSKVHRAIDDQALTIERLEDRCMLNADFALGVGETLLLDGFTANESLVLRRSSTDYLFQLMDGTWQGTDTAEIVGNGSSVLAVNKLSLNAFSGGVRVDDSLDVDFDVLFNNIDMPLMEGPFNILGVGDVTQLQRTRVDRLFIEALNVTLDNPGNVFVSIAFRAENFTLVNLDSTNIVTPISIGFSAADSLYLESEKKVTQNTKIFVSGDATFVTGGNHTVNQELNVDGVTTFDVTGQLTVTENLNGFDRINIVADANVTLDVKKVNFVGVNSIAGNLVVTSATDITDAPSATIQVGAKATLDAGGTIRLADHVSNNLSVSGNTALVAGGQINVGSAGDVAFKRVNFQAVGQANIREADGFQFFGNNFASASTITATGSISDAHGAQVNIASYFKMDGEQGIFLGDRFDDVLHVGGRADLQGETAIQIFKKGQMTFGRLNFQSAGFVSIVEDNATTFVGLSYAKTAVVFSTGKITDYATAGITTTSNLFLDSDAKIYIGNDAGNLLDVGGTASFVADQTIHILETSTANFGQLTVDAGGFVSIAEDSATNLRGKIVASRLSLVSAGVITDSAGLMMQVDTVASLTAATGIRIANTDTDSIQVCGFALFNAGDFVIVGEPGTVTLATHFANAPFQDITVDSTNC